MPQCILDCGPAFVFWLFPTERFLGVLGQFIHTAKNPVKNLARNIEFLEDYKMLKMINPSDLSHYSTTRKMMMMLLKRSPLFNLPLILLFLLFNWQEIKLEYSRKNILAFGPAEDKKSLLLYPKTIRLRLGKCMLLLLKGLMIALRFLRFGRE